MSTTFDEYQSSPPELYDRHIVPSIGAPCAAALLDVAGLRPGERVLDVACGTGVVVRLAAEQVGPGGTLTGVDLNPGMLHVARQATVPGAVDRVDWQQGDAAALPTGDDAFDAVLCSLGLQFFPDKVAALGEMHRTAAPGGRVVTCTCGPTPPLFTALGEVLTRHIGPETKGFIDAVFSVHDSDDVRAMMTAAGLRDIDVRAETITLQLPPPADFFWQYVLGTPLAAAVASTDDATRAAMEHDIVDRWTDYVHGGTLTLVPDLLLATARP